MSLTGGLTANQPGGINKAMMPPEFTFLRNYYTLVCTRDHGIKFCQAL